MPRVRVLPGLFVFSLFAWWPTGENRSCHPFQYISTFVLIVGTEMTLSVTLEQIEFSGGFELDLVEGDLLVVVGPNNAGKSALLSLIRDSFFYSGKPSEIHNPIGNAKIKKVGNNDSFSSWLEEHGELKNGTYHLVTGTFRAANTRTFSTNGSLEETKKVPRTVSVRTLILRTLDF